MQEITITAINQSGGKITLEEQVGGQQYPTRYSFFENFPDGKSTPVYDQYQDLGLKVGDIVTIDVKETKKANQFGKEVTYRNITSFGTGDALDTTSCTKTSQNSPQASTVRPMYDSFPKKDIKTTMDYKARQISGFQDDKQESMRLFSSGRDATLIVTEFYKNDTMSDEQIKKKIIEWRDYFYKDIYHMDESTYKALNCPF